MERPAAVQLFSSEIERVRIVVRGAVQGVGFRPFIYCLADSHNLRGWVTNTPGGVVIEVEGTPGSVRSFVTHIETDKPEAAVVQSLEQTYLDIAGYTDFKIRESLTFGQPTTTVMADLATCNQCLQEMADPTNRRYRYPFTNCTHCGPRYSIVLDLPYDRPNTTMRDFPMCTDCRAEYENVLDRRFHAQPIACPQCGPQITLLDKDGIEIAARDKALLIAAQKLRAGQILGLKGIGGFQILVNASSEDAVRELRLRKRREEKPFAVMFPTLEMAEDSCNIGDLERRLLRSAQSPIVIVEAKESSQLARSVAPGNPDVGIMIPYSPLHHLLLEAAGIPVVATSGNLSEEPICIDEREAISALSGIVDFYLVHNRPIARHVDDSVVRIIAGRETVLRRARGYAPLPLPLGSSYLPFLAVGAHQKSTIALSVDSSAVVSQHIGDLDTLGTWNVFNRVINDLSRMYDHKPVAIACDLHPDYRSTSYAAASGLNVLKIQHHYAHILSCMADNHLTGDVLGLAWDGTGYGADGTIWGGEFLTVSDSGYSRHARLFPFRLPGGESAVHEPRRTALGLLYAAMGNGSLTQCDIAVIRTFTKRELQNISTMLHNGLNSPVTSSMGRLFDGIAAIAGVRYQVRHEGQAAMQLEYLARGSDDIASYELPLVSHLGILTADWRPMIWEIIRDLEFGVSLEDIARRFHNSLAELAVAAARSAGIERVVMSGGCFQNRLLTEACINGLRDAGFTPYWHQRTPPNDGGIALGQLVGAGRALAIQTRISVKVL